MVVYLVRHAEKVDDSRDPPLSSAGEVRAARLAEMLAEAGIERIHSTDLRRTRDTATPLADTLGITVELYDPFALSDLAARLRAEGGVHLVVGHSNTTPEMVTALGGDPVSPIDELEYDRLYVVRVAPDGSVDSALRRFGARFGGEARTPAPTRRPAGA